MEGNGTFIPQAFTDLLLFRMNISCAFVSIILISFPLQSRAETENSEGYGDEGATEGGEERWREGDDRLGEGEVGGVVRNKRDERGG